MIAGCGRTKAGIQMPGWRVRTALAQHQVGGEVAGLHPSHRVGPVRPDLQQGVAQGLALGAGVVGSWPDPRTRLSVARERLGPPIAYRSELGDPPLHPAPRAHVLGQGIRRVPRVFALAVVGSALYGVMTAGTAWALGRVTRRGHRRRRSRRARSTSASCCAAPA